jgi:hypothetical protein
MAKYKNNTTPKKNPTTIYPSEFGSHKSMIDPDYSEINENDDEFVVCKDDRGSYLTSVNNLDNKLCDYNRATNIKKREEMLAEHIKSI